MLVREPVHGMQGVLENRKLWVITSLTPHANDRGKKMEMQ